MSRLQKPFNLTVGIPAELTFTVYDNQASAIQDLTGYTGSFAVANKITPTTSAISVSMSIVNASEGTIKVSLSAANLTTLGEGLFTCQLQLSVGGTANTVVDQPEIFVRGAI